MRCFSYGWYRVLLATLLSAVITGMGLAAEPVYMNTPEGVRRLHQSDLSSPYYRVAPYADTQENMGFCGPASMVAVLNSLSEIQKPAVARFAPYRYFTQSSLFNAETRQVKDYDAVARNGLTLSEVSRFLEKLNVPNQIYYGANLSLDTLRSLLLKALSDPHARVIVDFDRHVLGQAGNGHYSPLVAYDADSDSVLILDVAKFKYPPFWVTLPDLLISIQTIDPDSRQSRGIVLVFEQNPEAEPDVTQ